MLDLRALSWFVALAEELHFGRTAEQCGVAQSFLSAQIARIEDRIGARLFNRGRRSAVTLTKAGQTFLAEARLVVQQAERAEQIGRMAGRGEAGAVHIGFVLSAALTGVLPDTLAALRQALPLIEVEAEPMDSPDQIAAIANGRLDLGFIRPRSSYPPTVEVQTVQREELLVALASDHPLARSPGIRAADLKDETFIAPHFGDTEGFADSIRLLARSGAFDPVAMLRTRDFMTALSLASAGYGVVLAPASIKNLHIRNITFRELQDHRDEAHLAMAWNCNVHRRIIDVILATLAERHGPPA